jgi:TatD DNase family protein
MNTRYFLGLSGRLASALFYQRQKVCAGVVHCFTGNGQALKAYLDMGLHIGITGWICDERRGIHLRELVRNIPLDRLMLETDAPFLLPRTLPAKPKDGRNEPGFLPAVLKTVAECLGKSPSEVAQVTTTTAQQFFRINPPK